MFLPDKKKVVSVILAKMKPDGSESHQEVAPEESIGEQDQVIQSIAEDLHAALKSDSIHGIAEALKAFCEYIQEEDLEQDQGE